MVKTLLGRLSQGVSMTGLCDTLWDVNTQVLEAVHSLHWGLIDCKVLVVPHLLCTEVHYQLLGVADVEKEIADLAPCLQVFKLLQEGDQTYHHSIVCKFPFIGGAGSNHTVKGID